MEKNTSDSQESETNSSITPKDNPDYTIAHFNPTRGDFKRCEIADRRLTSSSPHSRGIITLRKINLVKVFCDELLMGEIQENYLNFKDDTYTFSVSDNSLVCFNSKNNLTYENHDMNPHEEQSECKAVASESVSQQVATVDLASRPDTGYDSLEQELCGSFIPLLMTVKQEIVEEVYNKPQDLISKSRQSKSVKLTKRTNSRKKLASKKNIISPHSNLPQPVNTEVNCGNYNGTSDPVTVHLTIKGKEGTDTPKRKPGDISASKIPTKKKHSKHTKCDGSQTDKKKCETVQYSCENVSSNFDDSSCSVHLKSLQEPSPKTSKKPTDKGAFVNVNINRQIASSVTEIVPVEINCVSAGRKRTVKGTKVIVAEVQTIGNSTKGGCAVAGGGRKNQSAVKHVAHAVEECKKECDNDAGHSQSFNSMKFRKRNNRFKPSGNSKDSGQITDFSENSSNRLLECSSLKDINENNKMQIEDKTVIKICNKKMQHVDVQDWETGTDVPHGKMLTRNQRAKLKSNTFNDASGKSQIRKLQENAVQEHSMVLTMNHSKMSVLNETLSSKHGLDDDRHGTNVLKSIPALNHARVKEFGNKCSFTKPTSSDNQQSNSASVSSLNLGGKNRSICRLSQGHEVSNHSICSEKQNQTETRLSFNRQSSLSDISHYSNRSQKAKSTNTLKQKGVALNATRNVQMGKLLNTPNRTEVCHEKLSHQEVDNSSEAQVPQRQLRKRKININLAEKLEGETLKMSMPNTKVKMEKQIKQKEKTTTGNVPEEHVQIMGNKKKQAAKKKSCTDMAVDNESTSQIKKEICGQQIDSPADDMPFGERPRKDKGLIHKKVRKQTSNVQPESLVGSISSTMQASLKFVGAHCSAAGGVSNAVFEAVAMGARAFGLFVRNGRTWKLNPLDVTEAEKFKQACKAHGFLPRHILPHGSYLLNCGSSNVDTLQKSRDTLIHELQICEMLGLEMYNFHPGSACGKGTLNECLMTVAESINLAHEKTKSVKTVIENMSCQGRTVGGKFEELKVIIDNVKDKSRIGVCLDTCHAFAAGFDLSSEEGFSKFMESFDRIVDLHYLCAMHLNDSKGELGCHLDRHENIGKGHIGLEGFRYVMNDSRLNNIPMILETPVNDYAREIKILYGLENQP